MSLAATVSTWRFKMGLRDKYAYAIQTAKGKFDGRDQLSDPNKIKPGQVLRLP